VSDPPEVGVGVGVARGGRGGVVGAGGVTGICRIPT
jgi:hypothetical protein